VAAPDQDPLIRELREQISEIDRGILDRINKRLELVARLKRHKDEHGISFLDPDREASMVDAQVRENPGPLSEEGLRSFYAELLALTKREVS
jgi:chorismate mutase / prephenate dehydratase